MFDLFDRVNRTPSAARFPDKAMVRKDIDAGTDVNALIRRAQSAAHYAPTGKNPRSSRGHIVFIVALHLRRLRPGGTGGRQRHYA